MNIDFSIFIGRDFVKFLSRDDDVLMFTITYMLNNVDY